ncbi:MAG: DedA family protein [Candidatus Cloacimonetes bacterium]|nr:DedA family protein [Candidatus Cloacimonadota bacterium]
MLKKVRALYDWTLSWAEKPQALWALFFLALVESSFFIVPPDVLLLAMCVARPTKSIWYAFVCSLGSVLGGAIGYAIGFWFYDSLGQLIVSTLHLERAFVIVEQKYQENVMLAVLVAAFTPIPYKVFTLAAGFFKVNFFEFMIASLFGRSARFFLVALLLYFFGPAIKEKIEKWFDVFAVVFTILLIGGFFVIKAL